MATSRAYGTRAEHLAWAKERALEYLPGDVTGAMTSFTSDLNKHALLNQHPVRELLFMHAMSGLMNAHICRELIEGTN